MLLLCVCVCVCVCVCSVIHSIMCYTSRAVSRSKAVGVATKDKTAYGVRGPHGKGDQTEHAYEMPDNNFRETIIINYRIIIP